MTDGPIDSFEVIGDADDLPETFFDALAALLLDLEERDESETNESENAE
jgi:hypothetical protein